jgi:hypothetical protein
MSDKDWHISRALRELECAGVSKEAREAVVRLLDGTFECDYCPVVAEFLDDLDTERSD